MPQFSTHCTEPKGSTVPALRSYGFDMQGKRLYTVVPELFKTKKAELSTRVDPMSKPVNLGTFPYKNGALRTRPMLTNCILPRTAVGGHCNGAVSDGEDVCKSSGAAGKSPCTEGTTTGENSSITVLSDETRLVCPEVAVHFSGTLLSSRVTLLGSSQCELEARLVRLQRRLREKQLLLVHHHVANQLMQPSEPAHHHPPGPPKPLPLGAKVACAQFSHRLRQGAKMVDSDMTDASSEEEEEKDEKDEEREDENDRCVL